MKLLPRIALTIVAFTIAAGVTYLVIHRWRAVGPKPNAVKTTGQQDTLEGVSGPVPGEVVTLPQLTTPKGDTVDLGNSGKERLLCVFISTRCPGCTRDAELWHELNQEAVRKDAGFYLINVSDERAEVESFVTAYHLEQLPVLFDPTHKVGPQLKIGFVPNTSCSIAMVRCSTVGTEYDITTKAAVPNN
jgi:peroxiredoxin